MRLIDADALLAEAMEEGAYGYVDAKQIADAPTIATTQKGQGKTMTVTCEIEDYSKPSQPRIRIHNAWSDSKKVEVEVKGERYTVDAEELISAVKRATLNVFGR